MNRINLDLLAKHLKPHLSTLVEKYAPNAKPVSNGWRLGSTAGEKGGSLWIGDVGFHDHSNNEQGSHLTLFSRLTGKSIIEVARQIAQDTNFKNPNDGVRIQRRDPLEKLSKELTPANIELLKSRGFDPQIIKQLPLTATANGDLAFLHFTADNILGFVKYYHAPKKSWYSDKGDTQHVPWLADVVTRLFPQADTLYITEGHWDAIAAHQAGFPAISIPNGANNQLWIETCYDFLHSFDKVVLCYDNDKVGREAMQIAATRFTRPVMTVPMPEGCKDLNDVLLQHGIDKIRELLSAPQPYSPPEIVRASTLVARAKEDEVCAFSFDTPWGNDFSFNIRSQESTVITAYTGHGKSNFVRQLISYLAVKHQARIGVASFEDTPIRVTGQILQNLQGLDEDQVLRALDNIQFLDAQHPKFQRKKIKIGELLASFLQMYQRHGTQLFVVDNLMTCDIPRDDLSAQADAAEEIRQFVINNPLHLALVAHPRKPPTATAENKLAPPDPHEIRGASEIADAAFNIVGIVRNIPKEREIDIKRKNPVIGPEEIQRLYQTKPDSILQVSKQRHNGKLPTIWLWRDALGNFHGSPQRTTKWW